MDIGQFIFIVGVFVVLHTYIIYPLILSVWNYLESDQTVTEELKNYPDVTLLIPGHNIEHLIDRKINNLMEVNYEGNLRYLFVLDGCTDNTEEKIKKYMGLHSRYEIDICINPNRQGKEAAIKMAIENVKTEVIIFSDADAILDTNCVKYLVKNLMKNKIGAVCGREIHTKINNSGASEGQGLFYKYEEFIKERLANIGSLPYIQGGNFAMLKSLYPKEIPPGCTQDGIIAFDVVLSGYKVAYEPKAITSEDYNLSTKEDYERRIRTISRAFYSILCRPAIFNPLKSGTYFYHILSGRLLRWLTLPILIISAIAGIFSKSIIIFYLSITGTFLILLLTLFGYFFEKSNNRKKLPYFAYYFIYIHLAAMIAIIKVLSGSRTTTWNPSN